MTLGKSCDTCFDRDMAKLTVITNQARQDAARRGFATLICESLPPKRPVGGFPEQLRQARREVLWIDCVLAAVVALPAVLVLVL
jgi:hypothetical protein